MSPPATLPDLLPMEVASRAELVRDALDRVGVDLLVVTKPANVRWLTGFTGSNGQLVVTADELIAITDGRYREQIAAELDASGVTATVEVTTTEVGDILARAAPSGARLGLESQHVTWKQHDQFAAWLPGRELVAVDSLLEELRKTKDPGERSRLERAAAMADGALSRAVGELGNRPTERDIAQQLDATMIELGADEPSYDTIVASGPNAALPHAHPTRRVIEGDDLVIIDVGARLDGYGSDMTRTFVAGGDPSGEQQRLYDAVIEAQAAGVEAVADGVEERHIDDVCRSVLGDHGLLDAFIHGTGHGIGLEIHEEPILSPRSTGILRTGLVVTVEPGVYLSERGGVRIEDSVVVTDDGCEPITHSPKRVVP
ncbi:MAG: Xaa-Pro peptidase family protein [Acidimicrobiia bacterium]|nr:Xaa-Pro peptidase family protein [Acidimicrobiia bacterium]